MARNESKLSSLARRWPSSANAVRDLVTRLKVEPGVAEASTERDARVPVRNPDIRGPLSVYYYDHFREALAAKGVNEASLPEVPALEGGEAELMEYEAMNLADGRRSVASIRDILTGRYAPVPMAFVTANFERWAQAGIISWK
jgi:hypothetical protein